MPALQSDAEKTQKNWIGTVRQDVKETGTRALCRRKD